MMWSEVVNVMYVYAYKCLYLRSTTWGAWLGHSLSFTEICINCLEPGTVLKLRLGWWCCRRVAWRRYDLFNHMYDPCVAYLFVPVGKIMFMAFLFIYSTCIISYNDIFFIQRIKINGPYVHNKLWWCIYMQWTKLFWLLYQSYCLLFISLYFQPLILTWKTENRFEIDILFTITNYNNKLQ